MQKFMSLFLAATFLAAAPVFASETSFGGDDEFTAMIDPSIGDEIQVQDDETLAYRRFCPRGWQRVPEYRWNPHMRRWEIVGWRCRRYGHGHGPGYPGNPGYPGDDGGGGPGHGPGH